MFIVNSWACMIDKFKIFKEKCLFKTCVEYLYTICICMYVYRSLHYMLPLTIFLWWEDEYDKGY